MSVMRRRRPLVHTVFGAVVALVFLAATGAALAQAAPDSFYLGLLRDGKSEMLRGDTLAAKKSFRLACFGFLEQPVVLAEGLVRLALAESALNDREAFVATFSRLAEVEERFAAYAPAALSADERGAFEARALEWVAPDLLRSLPSFAPLLARKTAVDLAKLSPRERTRELEKRSSAEPGNFRWKVLLAEDEAAEDHPAKVLSRLDGVPDSATGGSATVTAGCLRGAALARLERCGEAIAPLTACATVTTDAVLAEARITCLLALERPDAAREFAAQIARPTAAASAVRKAIRQIPPPAAAKAEEKGRKGSVKEKSPTQQGTVPTPVVAAEKKAPAKETAAPAQPSAPSNSPRMTADEERLVAEASRMLKSVENRDELRRGLASIQPLVDRYPGRSDLQLLAGGIAYRAGLWAAGAQYFRRSTPGGRGPTDPTQRFYLAVCLYEAGDFDAAAEVAATGLEKLQRPPFVEGYLEKIRAARP